VPTPTSKPLPSFGKDALTAQALKVDSPIPVIPAIIINIIFIKDTAHRMTPIFDSRILNF